MSCPDYYLGKGGIQPQHLIHALDLGYDEGTIVAYVARWRRKGEGIRDLYKARAHLDWLIAAAEGKPSIYPTPEDYGKACLLHGSPGAIPVSPIQDHLPSVRAAGAAKVEEIIERARGAAYPVPPDFDVVTDQPEATSGGMSRTNASDDAPDDARPWLDIGGLYSRSDFFSGGEVDCQNEAGAEEEGEETPEEKAKREETEARWAKEDAAFDRKKQQPLRFQKIDPPPPSEPVPAAADAPYANGYAE